MARKKNDRLIELMAEFEAEDAAVRYLAELPPQDARSVALKVAKSLATRWKEEKSEMIRRGDQRKVYLPHPEEGSFLDAELARLPPHDVSHSVAEEHLIELLAVLPPDAAAWIGYKVALSEVHHCRREGG